MQASAVKQARTILRSTALSAGYGGGLVCTQLVMIAGAHIFRAALSSCRRAPQCGISTDA